MFELKKLPAVLKTRARKKKINNVCWSRIEDFDYISTDYFVMRIHLPNYPAAALNALLKMVQAVPNNGQGVQARWGSITNMSQEDMENQRKYFGYNQSSAVRTGFYTDIATDVLAGIFNTEKGRMYIDKRFLDLVNWTDDLKVSCTPIGIRVEDNIGNILLACPIYPGEEAELIHSIYLK